MENEPWWKISSDLLIEIEQADDEGLEIQKEKAKEEVAKILALPQGERREENALAFYQTISRLPLRPDYPYREPSDWEGIRATLKGESLLDYPLPDNLSDRIRGAWFGRTIGCLLGKPFEGWHSERYYPFLKETGQYPLHDYATFALAPGLKEKYGVDIEKQPDLRRLSRETIAGMPEDDDTNYTVLALKLVEEKGRDFSSADVAWFWLRNLPFLHLCTAERVAYRNLVRGMEPPATAQFANPYREWIGAQIRADFFGYLNPGNPLLAAEMAWRDASISHVKNGIYGAMFVAAALALALVEDDLGKVLQGALDYIPPQSRLHAAIRQAFAWHEKLTFAEAYTELHRHWDETNPHHWCHTIANAQIVVLALLYGEMDFGRTICRAVDLLLDTDCNAATAGSILGALIGEKAIPTSWKEPLQDTLETGVVGYNRVSLSTMAEKTLAFLAER